MAQNGSPADPSGSGTRRVPAIDTSTTPTNPDGSLTLTDMMVSPIDPDQLPQYREPSSAPPLPARPSPSTNAFNRDVKDPVYAPFLPAEMTSTSGDASFISPSDVGHGSGSAGPSRRPLPHLAIATEDLPSPMYSLSPPSATAAGGVSVTGPLSPFSDTDIAEWKRGNAPFLEASANVDDEGQIDVSIEIRGSDKPLPALPPLPERPPARRATGTASTSPAMTISPPWSPGEDSSTSSRAEMESLASASRAVESDKKGKGKQKEEWYKDTVPVMNIVIFIVGSRGDVQPYIALALALITSHGHRVRIATHPDFKQFVLSANSRLTGLYHLGMPLEGRLEFFDAGGDPKSLMEYMVKNPGLLPGFDSIKNGDIGKKQKMTADMLRGFYRSTFCPDVQSGREFAADAIISNPPAFAHIHVAEALGIPLHMSFTMPWTATQSFPHPLVNVSRSNADKSLTNWMGYGLAEILMWQGLGSQINTFRSRDLRIEELPDRVASDILDRQKIPWTYCWSPELLPKPLDWRGHIDISGFYFLDGDNSYTPPPDLQAFLQAGPAPVYIGFGSVVIKDPAAMTDMLFEAINTAGVRAIISAGWAGLGKGREVSDPNILIWSKDVPHEWLFADDRVSAVMHHGGAGTTACGLRHGRPTIIVPFFGDQKFWGEAVHRADAGPAPIPIKTISVEAFAAALTATQTDAMRTAAGVLGEKIRSEKGDVAGVESFHRHLPFHDMRCDVDPRRVATLYCPRLTLRLSAEAAGTLLERGKVLSHELEVYRTREYETTRQVRGPISSTGQAMNNVVTTTFAGVGQLFYSPVQGTIKTFYGIPEASLAVVGDMYEGFHNMPGIMGSTVRHHKPVTGFVSGMAEGGKALGWGLWDGIFGFFLDPVDGARREGFAGFGKGLGRGTANLMFRPLAGSLGLFVHPTRGAAQSVKNMFSGKHEPTGVLASPRLWLAKEAASRLSVTEKDAMMGRLKQLDKDAKKRARDRAGSRVFLLANRREIDLERAHRKREKEERSARKALDKAKAEAEALNKDAEVEVSGELVELPGEVEDDDRGKGKSQGKGKEGMKVKGKEKKKIEGKKAGKNGSAAGPEGPGGLPTPPATAIESSSSRNSISTPLPNWRHGSAFGDPQDHANGSMHKGRLRPDESPLSSPSPDTATLNDGSSTAPPSWRAGSAFGLPRDGDRDSMAKGRIWRTGSASEASMTSAPSMSMSTSTGASSWRRGSAFGVRTDKKDGKP